MAESSTIIRIAPTKEEKLAKKEFEKQTDFFKSEKIVDAADGTRIVKSRRNYDHFVGGPLDGQETSHQPNGPEQSWDKGRHWADYYFKDTMTLPFEQRKVEGFHMYSSSKALQQAYKHGSRHKDHKSPNLSIGTRGPNYVKMYYYIGFFEEGILFADGICPADFKGILTLS